MLSQRGIKPNRSLKSQSSAHRADSPERDHAACDRPVPPACERNRISEIRLHIVSKRTCMYYICPHNKINLHFMAGSFRRLFEQRRLRRCPCHRVNSATTSSTMVSYPNANQHRPYRNLSMLLLQTHAPVGGVAMFMILRMQEKLRLQEKMPTAPTCSQTQHAKEYN